MLLAFEGRLLPVDGAAARCRTALQTPDPRPLRDALIAATALAHAMVLGTCHGSEVLPTAMEAFHPWSEPSGETPEAPTQRP